MRRVRRRSIDESDWVISSHDEVAASIDLPHPPTATNLAPLQDYDAAAAPVVRPASDDLQLVVGSANRIWTSAHACSLDLPSEPSQSLPSDLVRLHSGCCPGSTTSFDVITDAIQDRSPSLWRVHERRSRAVMRGSGRAKRLVLQACAPGKGILVSLSLLVPSCPQSPSLDQKPALFRMRFIHMLVVVRRFAPGVHTTCGKDGANRHARKRHLTQQGSMQEIGSEWLGTDQTGLDGIRSLEITWN